MEENTYTPFQDNYQIVALGQLSKCEYCGKPNMHANCHAHARNCPYYCGNINNAPIGDGLGILIALAFAYLSYKIFTKEHNK